MRLLCVFRRVSGWLWLLGDGFGAVSVGESSENEREYEEDEWKNEGGHE